MSSEEIEQGVGDDLAGSRSDGDLWTGSRAGRYVPGRIAGWPAERTPPASSGPICPCRDPARPSVELLRERRPRMAEFEGLRCAPAVLPFPKGRVDGLGRGIHRLLMATDAVEENRPPTEGLLNGFGRAGQPRLLDDDSNASTAHLRVLSSRATPR